MFTLMKERMLSPELDELATRLHSRKNDLQPKVAA